MSTKEEIRKKAERLAEESFAQDIEFDAGWFGHTSPATRTAMSGYAKAKEEDLEKMEADAARIKELEAEVERLRAKSPQGAQQAAEGPYYVERNPETHNASFHRVMGPKYIGVWMSRAEANCLMGQLNAAFLAGASWRAGKQISVEQIMDAVWKCAQASSGSSDTLVFIEPEDLRSRLTKILTPPTE